MDDVNNLRTMGQKVVCHNLLINRTVLLYMSIYFMYKISDHVAAVCETGICIRFYKEESNLKLISGIKLVTSVASKSMIFVFLSALFF